MGIPLYRDLEGEMMVKIQALFEQVVDTVNKENPGHAFDFEHFVDHFNENDVFTRRVFEVLVKEVAQRHRSTQIPLHPSRYHHRPPHQHPPSGPPHHPHPRPSSTITFLPRFRPFPPLPSSNTLFRATSTPSAATSSTYRPSSQIGRPQPNWFLEDDEQDSDDSDDDFLLNFGPSDLDRLSRTSTRTLPLSSMPSPPPPQSRPHAGPSNHSTSSSSSSAPSTLETISSQEAITQSTQQLYQLRLQAIERLDERRQLLHHRTSRRSLNWGAPSRVDPTGRGSLTETTADASERDVSTETPSSIIQPTLTASEALEADAILASALHYSAATARSLSESSSSSVQPSPGLVLALSLATSVLEMAPDFTSAPAAATDIPIPESGASQASDPVIPLSAPGPSSTTATSLTSQPSSLSMPSDHSYREFAESSRQTRAALRQRLLIQEENRPQQSRTGDPGASAGGVLRRRPHVPLPWTSSSRNGTPPAPESDLPTSEMTPGLDMVTSDSVSEHQPFTD